MLITGVQHGPRSTVPSSTSISTRETRVRSRSGKGYNTVKVETTAIFHSEIPGVSRIPGINTQATFRASQQVDDQGNYWSWSEVN